MSDIWTSKSRHSSPKTRIFALAVQISLSERRHHTEVFSFHKLSLPLRVPIDHVEFTSIRGLHGMIPESSYPFSGRERKQARDAAALIYFHGFGYTVGRVDEFENGCRLLAEESGVQVYAVEYRLAPEWQFPAQLDEYQAVLQWVQNEN